MITTKRPDAPGPESADDLPAPSTLRIAAQEAVVTRMDRRGQDTTLARSLLDVFDAGLEARRRSVQATTPSRHPPPADEVASHPLSPVAADYLLLISRLEREADAAQGEVEALVAGRAEIVLFGTAAELELHDACHLRQLMRFEQADALIRRFSARFESILQRDEDPWRRSYPPLMA